MGCCFKKPKSESKTKGDEESSRADQQNQPLIDNGNPGSQSPSGTRKKKKSRQPAEINPFNKPRK